MQYRLYARKDFDPLYAIEELCFQPPFRFGRRYMRQLVNRPYAATWIAEENDRLAGFAIVEWTQEIGQLVAYIPTIEVSPEWRGQGIGGELLQRVEGSGREAGAALIWLHVDAENYGAIRLYEAKGYVAQGRQEDFYAPSRAGLIYGKSLRTTS